jgi:hypothetical protein
MLEQLRRFRGHRHREVFRRVELLPVALARKHREPAGKLVERPVTSRAPHQARTGHDTADHRLAGSLRQGSVQPPPGIHGPLKNAIGWQSRPVSDNSASFRRRIVDLIGAP